MMLRPCSLDAGRQAGGGHARAVAVLESVLSATRTTPARTILHSRGGNFADLERAVPSALRLMTLFRRRPLVTCRPYLSQTGDTSWRQDQRERRGATSVVRTHRRDRLYPLM